MSSSTSRVKPSATTKGSLTRSAFGSSTSSIASITSERSTVGGTSNLRKSPSCNEILNPNADSLEVGDRIYVNGVQPATIRYLNETSFAPGIWAGLELDTDNGKNDGSVNNVRYFECRPKHGLFVRPHRLTLEPLQNQTVKSPSEVPDVLPATDAASSVPKTSNHSTNLNVGDCVVVNATSGLKAGVLRFLGETEFASGIWAGVELNEATGKNDGSVAGRRYFVCEMNRGLFAPIHKVTKSADRSSKVAKTPARVPQTQTLTRRCLKRSGFGGSQESLTSITSATSLRSGRIKLGVTSLSSQNKDGSPTKKATTAAASSTSSALHQTLREKEDHISQLLNERETERGEVARMTLRVEELEQEHALLRNEHQRYIQEKVDEIQNLKQALEEAARIQKELMTQLDEERKKVEVFEFRLEEEMVNSMEIKEEMEKLIGGHRSGKEDERDVELFQLQEDVIKKEEKLLQLETTLQTKKQETQALLKRAKESEDQLAKAEHRQSRYLETIDELNLKLSKKDNEVRRAEEVQMQLKEELNALREEIENTRNRSHANSSLQESLHRQLKSKDGELGLLQNRIGDMSKEIRSLKDEKLAMEKERSNMEFSLDEKEATISTLNSECSELNHELKVLKEETRKLNMEIKAAKCRNDEGSVQVQSLLSDIEKQRAENAELSRQLEDFRQQLENVRVESHQKLAEKDVEINVFLKSESELKNEVALKTREGEKLRQQLHEALAISGDNSAKWEKLDTELKAKQAEISSLRDELRSLKGLFSKSENDVKRFSEEAKDLTALVAKRNDDIESLKKDLREKEEDLFRKTHDLSAKQMDSESFRREVETLQGRLSAQESDLKSLADDLHACREQLAASNSEKTALSAELREVKCTLFEKENEVSKLMSSKFEMENHIHDLVKQVQDLKETNTELVHDREKLLKTIRIQERGVDEREETIKKLKDQLNIMREQFSDYRDSLETELSKSKLDSESVLVELRSEIQSVQDENEKLRSVNADLEDEIRSLKENMSYNESRHKEVMDGFEQECQRLENRIEELKKVVADKNVQLEDREKVVMQMERESKNSVDIYKRKMEAEKANLIRKVELLESSINANVVAFKDGRGSDSKESYESQIDFLNSVIVDMQKKNDDLKARVQVLEEIGLTDFEENAPRKANGHLPRAPRLFCDVCDVFDLHDTEDCPQQMKQQVDYNTHSHYQSSRKMERPYCTNCEVFGHPTESCKDDQSF